MVSIQQSVTGAQGNKDFFFSLWKEGERREIKDSVEVLSSVVAHQERNRVGNVSHKPLHPLCTHPSISHH